VAVEASGEDPVAAAPAYRSGEFARHRQHPLLDALAVDEQAHLLGVVLDVGRYVDLRHLQASQAHPRAEHHGQHRVLVL